MLYIRTDSNSIISGGHVMRCIAIAKSMQKTGLDVCFLISDESSTHLLMDSDLKYIVLNSDWQDLMTDVETVKKILQRTQPAILLIDTYSVTKEYIDALKPYCKVGYLGSKKEYLGDLDFLINYSTDIDYRFYCENYGKKTRLFLGPSYAPLRDEFQKIEHLYRDRIERIFLTTGNTDCEHIVDSIIEGLQPHIQGAKIVLDVVLGRMFENKNYLKKKYGQDNHIVFHDNVKSMSVLMKECDLAISANGTTVYELSAMGLPTISFAMVEEQVNSAEAMSRLGVIDYCGRSYMNKDECVKLIVERVNYYINHHGDLINLAQKAHDLIDGNGCRNIVMALMG